MTDREKYERALYFQQKAKADRARQLEASRKSWPAEFRPNAKVLPFPISKPKAMQNEQ